MILNFNDVDFLYNKSICSFVPRLCLQWTATEKETLSNDKPAEYPATQTTFYVAS